MGRGRTSIVRERGPARGSSAKEGEGGGGRENSEGGVHISNKTKGQEVLIHSMLTFCVCDRRLADEGGSKIRVYLSDAPTRKRNDTRWERCMSPSLTLLNLWKYCGSCQSALRLSLFQYFVIGVLLKRNHLEKHNARPAVYLLPFSPLIYGSRSEDSKKKNTKTHMKYTYTHQCACEF